MRRKIMAFVLCLAMLMSMFVPGTLATSAASDSNVDQKVTVYYNGNHQSNVTLPKGSSVELSASAAGSVSCQWQINAGGTWVDIYGETGTTIRVSYALVKSLLVDGTAQLRVEADGTVCSDPITITVSEADANAAVAIPEVGADHVVLPAPEATVYEVSQPTGETAGTVDVAALEAAVTEAQSAYLAAKEASDAATAAYDATVVAAETDASEEAKTTLAAAEAEKAAADQNLADAEAAFDAAMAAYNEAAGTAVAVAAETPDLNEYTVVVNYVFENNVIVADPYTATLAAGSNFSATVNHPAVMGYLPYVGDANETSTGIDLNITNIQADVTYTVTYKPTNVNYTVIHYQQNLDNDNYTIAETETRQGLTKSTVPEVAKDYDGFYALLYERPEIAADGSTVVEIYYDRNYYLVNFDLGGGYGVEPIYARYGTPINIGSPTRAGYSFAGWSPEVPATVPVGGGIYTAQWTANDTAKVKVVIWGENPNDEEYSYLTTGELMLKPGTEYTYNGTDQLYLYCDKETHTHSAECLTCTKTEHTQHTEDCLNCVHTHTLNCYSVDNNVQLQETTKPSQITVTPENGGIYTYTDNGGFLGGQRTFYYLYLDGKWYCSGEYDWGLGTMDAGRQEISLKCTHTHGDDCYTCEIHAHTAACYGCGKEVHTHDSNCTGTVAGLDSDLWTFVKSDTVTVAANGSSVINVYYDRTTFTMTFHYNYSRNSGYQTTETIEDKWGADIGERFLKISENANGNLWSMETDGSSPWTSYLQIMPQYDEDFYCDITDTNAQSAEYYVENLQGEYELKYTVGAYYSDGTLTISKEDFYEMEGFTYATGTDGDGKTMSKPGSYGDFDGAKFYYTRHKYAIEFYSPTTLIKTETGVLYEAPLNSYDWTPDASTAPNKYEPGTVVFEGWYLNPECTGEKFDFTTHTMPSGTNDGDTTLTLYAKWVPVTRTVEFYLDQDDMENNTDMLAKRETPHGSVLNPGVEAPTNGDYTFVGWFYMDGDEEKGFVDTMPITKDMKVYAKWSSNVLKEYTVYFKIQGNDTQIADPITGSSLAGITKTFDAKGGTDLYAGYQEGYFPLVESHSMTLNIEHENNQGDNTYTFWYVQKDAVPYKVYYVAETLKEGGTSLGTIERDGKTYHIIATTKEVNDNRKAVVTEKFEQVSGYMPDAYQKRLVVNGTEGAVNEIIFYYTVDSTHAYYKITHYTQNTDGENWTVYDERQFTGEIGQTYSAEPLTIDGFTYDPDAAGTLTSGNLTAEGLELKLYYVRNSYPYEVRYLEQGSGKELADPKTGTGLYGAVVSESAIDIANYTAVDPTSQTLTIKIEEDATAKLNIITFYYTEQEVEIKYEAVGNGTVTDPSNANTAGASGSETLKVLSGTAQGSTATADKNYKFVGWYSDEECTKLVSENAKYVPEKVDDKNVAATYYAKFELDVADLTITKTGEINTYDADQSFIFRVTGPNGFSLDVVINGTGSVTIKDLPIGTYTVKEITEWSWRYTPDGGAEKSVTLGAGENKVTFNNVRNDNIYWLAGDSFKENQFTVKPKNDEE